MLSVLSIDLSNLLKYFTVRIDSQASILYDLLYSFSNAILPEAWAALQSRKCHSPSTKIKNQQLLVPSSTTPIEY